jgi:zinc transporter ZupT
MEADAWRGGTVALWSAGSEAMDEAIWWAGVTGIGSALATGLGALAALALKVDDGVASRARLGFASAFAGGMMLAASMHSLIGEGLAMGEGLWGAASVLLGVALGAGFFWGAERLIERRKDEGHVGGMSARTLLLFGALFVHSIPEGLAIGVGFATGDIAFGATMAAIIALHNVPEGIAMSLPMRAEGASIARCAGASVLTSLPQALLAAPAALAFGALQGALPVGMGFAAGAMIYVVAHELLPEALEQATPAAVAWGVTLGSGAMIGVSSII